MAREWYLPQDASTSEKKAIYAAATTTDHCMLWVPVTSRRLSLMRALFASLKHDSVAVVSPKPTVSWWKKALYSRETQIVHCSTQCPEVTVAVLDLDDGMVANVPKVGRCIGIVSAADFSTVLPWKRLPCLTEREFRCEIKHVANTLEDADQKLFAAARVAAKRFHIKATNWQLATWDKDLMTLALKKQIRDALGTKEILLRLARMRSLVRDGQVDHLQQYIGSLPHGEIEEWFHEAAFVDFTNAVTAAHLLGDPLINAICELVNVNVQTLILTTDVQRVYAELQNREVAVEKIVKPSEASAICPRWLRSHLRVVVAGSMSLLSPLVMHGLRKCDVCIMATAAPLNGFAHRMEIDKTIWVVPEGRASQLQPPILSHAYQKLASEWVEKAVIRTTVDFDAPVWPIESVPKSVPKSGGKRARVDDKKQLKLADFGLNHDTMRRASVAVRDYSEGPAVPNAPIGCAPVPMADAGPEVITATADAPNAVDITESAEVPCPEIFITESGEMVDNNMPEDGLPGTVDVSATVNVVAPPRKEKWLPSQDPVVKACLVKAQRFHDAHGIQPLPLDVEGPPPFFREDGCLPANAGMRITWNFGS